MEKFLKITFAPFAFTAFLKTSASSSDRHKHPPQHTFKLLAKMTGKFSSQTELQRFFMLLCLHYLFVRTRTRVNVFEFLIENKSKELSSFKHFTPSSRSSLPRELFASTVKASRKHLEAFLYDKSCRVVLDVRMVHFSCSKLWLLQLFPPLEMHNFSVVFHFAQSKLFSVKLLFFIILRDYFPRENLLFSQTVPFTLSVGKHMRKFSVTNGMI